MLRWLLLCVLFSIEGGVAFSIEPCDECAAHVACHNSTGYYAWEALVQTANTTDSDFTCQCIERPDVSVQGTMLRNFAACRKPELRVEAIYVCILILTNIALVVHFRRKDRLRLRRERESNYGMQRQARPIRLPPNPPVSQERRRSESRRTPSNLTLSNTTHPSASRPWAPPLSPQCLRRALLRGTRPPPRLRRSTLQPQAAPRRPGSLW